MVGYFVRKPQTSWGRVCSYTYIPLEFGQGLPTARNPMFQVLGIGLDNPTRVTSPCYVIYGASEHWLCKSQCILINQYNKWVFKVAKIYCPVSVMNNWTFCPKNYVLAFHLRFTLLINSKFVRQPHMGIELVGVGPNTTRKCTKPNRVPDSLASILNAKDKLRCLYSVRFYCLSIVLNTFSAESNCSNALGKSSLRTLRLLIIRTWSCPDLEWATSNSYGYNLPSTICVVIPFT